MFNHPKRRKARYHRLTLNTGHILEIGWHFGRQMYVVTVWHPDNYKDTDVWAAEKQFFGHAVREVLSGARLEIAEQVNPAIKKVRQQVAPQSDDVLTMEKVIQQKMPTLGGRYGVLVLDELADSPDSIFAASNEGMDAFKYLMSSTDKKPRE